MILKSFKDRAKTQRKEDQRCTENRSEKIATTPIVKLRGLLGISQ